MIGAGISAWFFQSEYDAFLDSKTQKTLRVSSVTADMPLPNSHRARTDLLTLCVDMQRPKALRFFATAQKDNIAQSCKSVAERTLEQSPTWSIAHLAVATSAIQLRDHKMFNTSLTASRRFGGYETWLADRRIALSNANRALLSPENETGLADDFRTLLQNKPNIARVVAYYRDTEALRPQIKTALEQSPKDIQSRFLYQLRQGTKTSEVGQ